MPNMPKVSLPDFSIDVDEFESAIASPLTEGVRFDMKISPDEHKPVFVRRVVVAGMKKWAVEGDGTSMTDLVIRLLYLYYTGQLNASISHQQGEGRFSYSDEESEDDDFEFDPAFTEV